MWQEQLAAVRAQLALAGLDVVHPLAVGWVEDLVAVDRPAAGLGLLIGNSKALWSRLAPHPDDPHPVDSHVERAVTEATALLDPVIRFAHRRYAGAFVPMQRVAERVGLAQLSPSMLCVHPEFGTWFSLRALALSAVPGPVGEPTKPQDFCGPCHKPCMPLMQAALARDDASWRDWLAARDACPIGAADRRYSQEQIRYHYTKERRWLPLGD